MSTTNLPACTDAVGIDSPEGPSQVPLGIVQMGNLPLTHPGNLGNPATFDYPVAYARAMSAFTDRILRREPEVAEDYIKQALRLESQGVRAMLTTCGFNVVYQTEIARRLSVPLATSSLLLLPLILRLVSTERQIGVVTFDRHQLDASLLEHAGMASADLARLHIVGLDGTRTWYELRKQHPDLPLEVIRDDVMQLVRGIALSGAAPGAVLLECSALVPFSPAIRQEFGWPVFDFLSLSDLLQSAATDVRPFGVTGRGK